MNYLFLALMLSLFVACGEDDQTPPTEYRCEQMTPENKVEGCKLGDWWNFDLQRCNSTLERCLK